MNQQERDELRAKHRVGQNEADDQCQACYSADGYPCDVIKVLDAWEAENDYWTQIENGTLPEMEVNECDHLWLTKAGSDYRANPAEICAKCDTVRRSCPKCGVKL